MKNIIVGVILLIVLSSFVNAAVSEGDTYQMPTDPKVIDPLKLVWQAIRTLQTQVTTLISDVLTLKSRATSCEARLAELETYTYPCVNGATRSCGTSNLGVCRFGTETCANHAWGTCVGAVNPGVETCNGLDDDCDGTVDNVIPLECGSDIGICVKGLQYCTNGYWGACEGAIIPEPETCNGRDDDCDGQVDEGCGLPDGSSCETGTQCTSGICADGYCCNSPCNGVCKACTMGYCLNFQSGQDPYEQCPGESVCDGNGFCTP